MPDIDVFVLYHRTPELLLECLGRLQACRSAAAITVIDSGSRDGAKHLVARSYPHVGFVTIPNHSMAAGVNTALKLSRRRLLCHMNADVLIEPDTLKTLAQALLAGPRSDSAALAGPRCVTRAGTTQDQGLPYRLHYARLAGRKFIDVPWLSGCIQLVDRTAAQTVGGMDASLRFYNEDIDWCTRFRRAGYLCRLVNTPVVHVGGSSTPAKPHFVVEGYRGGYLLSLRYAPRWYRLLHRAAVTVESSVKMRFAKDPKARHAYRAIRTMFQQGAFFHSPFGASLEEPNPDFCWPAPGGAMPASAPAEN